MPAALDLTAIRERCRSREFAPHDGRLNQDFMAFGARWANIRRISFGVGEALAEVSLDDCFVGDLDGYGLHPALLDMATGGAQSLIPGADLTREFYVPLAYGTIRVFGQMPSRVFSHVRCLTSSGNGVAFFDITLSDADGRVFADISQFTMKRLDPGASLGAPASSRSVERARNDPMAAMLREAISAPEGLDALDRIMAQPGIVQAMASSVDVNLWNTQLGLASAPRDESEVSLEGFQRPDLASDYVAPTSRTELTLSKIWSELLGVRQVGINDNFFDLGGNSLSGVRLFGAIRKQFQVTLPLATLFEAQSIAELAALLPQDGAGLPQPEAATAQSWSPLVRIKAGSPDVAPFFFVHGSRGNVLLFKSFADKFG
ncbi:MAG: polyketide synthase dehydratase domain-containing protein, partial [Bradyrhizobium sp.]